MDNEFILQDRIQKIRQIINDYGEENFYLSFSGGKDSVVLHTLLDMAIPNNKIPRVYCNTGLEYKLMVDFVKGLNDNRIEIIYPEMPIKQVLEKYGYPFKSKEHSLYWQTFKNTGISGKLFARYLHPSEERKRYGCPKILRYQFEDIDNFKLNISDKCCTYAKEKPLAKWQKEHNKPYKILGITGGEYGRRNRAKCVVFTNGGAI